MKRFDIMELNICESRRFLKYCLRRNIANSSSEIIFCFSTSNFCCWWPALQNVKSRLFRKSFTLAAFNVTCSAKLEQQIWKCLPSENVARSASEMHSMKVYLIAPQLKVSFIQHQHCTCNFPCNSQLSMWPALLNWKFCVRNVLHQVIFYSWLALSNWNTHCETIDPKNITNFVSEILSWMMEKRFTLCFSGPEQGQVLH